MSYFTWHFKNGYQPYSVTVVALSEKEAKEKIDRYILQGKILNLKGPGTTDITSPPLLVKLNLALRDQKPVVTSTDCIIAVSSLEY